jgi:plasmid stabilization system protein ParE
VIRFSIEFTLETELETLQAFVWYENIRKGLGLNFKNALDSKINLLKQNPQTYSIIYKNIRSAKLRSFPYNIIYRVFEQEIQVLAVFHNSRSPRQWKKRI